MTMKKVEETGMLPGPQAALLSGFSDNDSDAIKALFVNEKDDLSFIRLTKNMLENTL